MAYRAGFPAMSHKSATSDSQENTLNLPTRHLQILVLALFLSLGVTNVPVAEDYHYVLILPSIIIAWWWALRSRPSRLWWGILLMAIADAGSPPSFSPSDVSGRLVGLAGLSSRLRRIFVMGMVGEGNSQALAEGQNMIGSYAAACM